MKQALRGAAVAAFVVVTAGAASVDLDAQEKRGKEIFLHAWTPGDPMSVAGDGVGPTYNASSCVACHAQGGAGGAGAANVRIMDGHVVHAHAPTWPPPPPPEAPPWK